MNYDYGFSSKSRIEDEKINSFGLSSSITDKSSTSSKKYFPKYVAFTTDNDHGHLNRYSYLNAENDN